MEESPETSKKQKISANKKENAYGMENIDC